MSWTVWLLIVLSLSAIIGGLMVLLKTAKPLPLTDEQLLNIHKREAEQKRKDAENE